MKDSVLPRLAQELFRVLKNYFLRFLQVQLVISLIILVILPSWGFTISMLSPLGNIIFTPIFTVFLLLSSLIFFAEILHIPNGFLIYILEKITQIWLYLIPDFNNTCLIGFTKPPLLFVLSVPLLTLAVLVHRKINSLKQSVLALAILFSLSCAYLKIINRPARITKHIPCNNGNITLIHEGNTALIDPGFMGRRISAPSWIEYTLIPEIIKSCGSNCIEHLIIMQPGKITFDALHKLITSITIKNIYLVRFFGSMKKTTARSFFTMKQEAEKRGINIHRIGFCKNAIELSKKITILLEPLEQTIAYNETSYPALCATCNIDNENLTIYSAKYKNSITNKKHGELYERTSNTSDCS